MPATRRTHQVQVHTTGPVTLDELEDLCFAARRAQIPGHTAVTLAGVPGAGQCLTLTYDYAANPPAPSNIRPAATHPGDAVTEQLQALPAVGPDTGSPR